MTPVPLRAYLASFRGQPPGRILARLAVMLLIAVATSAGLYGLTAVLLVLCAILIGFALVVPVLLLAVACVVLIVIRPKQDSSLAPLLPLLGFVAFWIWSLAKLGFHF